MGEGLKRAAAAARATRKVQSKLTDKQRQILAYLKRQPEGARTVWIAEMCGHAYETPWASTAMPRLLDLGLVARQGLPGWYVITEAGRAAIETGDGA